MAVYKATYCQPLLKSVDIRTVPDESVEKPCEWLVCKINSSNKKITGYKIRILDSANNQIFPSPLLNEGRGYISDVQGLWYSYSEEEQPCSFDNLGLNGAMLKIPFFQNYALGARRQTSLNAVYYIPRYKADFYPEVPINRSAIDEDHLRLSAALRIDAALPGAEIGNTVLIFQDTVSSDDATIVCERGLFKITNITTMIAPYPKKHYELERIMEVGTDALKEHEVVIIKGGSHDKIFYFDDS